MNRTRLLSIVPFALALAACSSPAQPSHEETGVAREDIISGKKSDSSQDAVVLVFFIDKTTYYAGSASIDLFSPDTANYRDNLINGEPRIWVALRRDGLSINVVKVDYLPPGLNRKASELLDFEVRLPGVPAGITLTESFGSVLLKAPSPAASSFFGGYALEGRQRERLTQRRGISNPADLYAMLREFGSSIAGAVTVSDPDAASRTQPTYEPVSDGEIIRRLQRAANDGKPSPMLHGRAVRNIRRENKTRVDASKHPLRGRQASKNAIGARDKRSDVFRILLQTRIELVEFAQDVVGNGPVLATDQISADVQFCGVIRPIHL